MTNDSDRIFWRSMSITEKWAVMNVCLKGIDFSFFYHLYILFWTVATVLYFFVFFLFYDFTLIEYTY